MLHRSNRLSVALLIAFLLFSPIVSRAQIRSGTITGLVTDPSGGPIAGAQVEAVQRETKTAYRTTTGSSGSYTVPYLESGTYTVTITATGFPTLSLTEIAVNTAETARADAQMKLGTLATSVEVSGRALELQTERASVCRTPSTSALSRTFPTSPTIPSFTPRCCLAWCRARKPNRPPR
jgi:hypothetical protein